MNKYKISVDGCDGTTKFTMELTREQADLIDRVSELSKETSTYGCEPIIYIEQDNT